MSALEVLGTFSEKAEDIVKDLGGDGDRDSLDVALDMLLEMEIGEEATAAMEMVCRANDQLVDVLEKLQGEPTETMVAEARGTVKAVVASLNLHNLVDDPTYATESGGVADKVMRGVVALRGFVNKLMTALANAFREFVRKHASVAAFARKKLAKKKDLVKDIELTGNFQMPMILIDNEARPAQGLREIPKMYETLTRLNKDTAKKLLDPKEYKDFASKTSDKAEKDVENFIKTGITGILPNVLGDKIKIFHFDEAGLSGWVSQPLPGAYGIMFTFIGVYSGWKVKLGQMRATKKIESLEVDRTAVSGAVLAKAIDDTIKGQMKLIKNTSDVNSTLAKVGTEFEKETRTGEWTNTKITNILTNMGIFMRGYTNASYSYSTLHLKALNKVVDHYIENKDKSVSGKGTKKTGTGTGIVPA